MLRDMTVKYELTGQGLQSTGPALGHLIVYLRRTDRLYIQPIRRIADGRKLYGTVLGQGRIELAGARLSGPADRTAMQMVRMHDLRPTDHPELGRIPQI